MRPISRLLKAFSSSSIDRTLTQPSFWTSAVGDRERIENNFEAYVQGAYKRNGVVFACVLARLLLFSEARFLWRRFEDGRPSDLFDSPSLSLLERPWPNGTTGELLASMEQDASLGGNSYWTAVGTGPERRLRRLRPDWVTIVTGSPDDDPFSLDARPVGYLYKPRGGLAGDATLLLPEQVAHYCVDEATEILTSDGWKDHRSLQVGDEALTLNHETGMSEWQPVKDICVFPSQRRDMLLMEGVEHSSLTTLNHRWPVERRNSRAARYERRWTTSDAFSTGDRVPTAAFCADLPRDPKWTDALVEAVGWFWTEGTIRRQRDGRLGRGISISQSYVVHEGNVARIRAALTVLFGAAVTARLTSGVPAWRESIDGDNVIFHLSAAAGDVITHHAPGRVPTTDFIRSLTASQLALFIDTSILADGHRDRLGRVRLAQKDRRSAEQFALACLLAGHSVSIRESKMNKYGYRMTIVSLRRGRAFGVGDQRGNFTRERVQHDGIVWCPRTPNQTWLARRNGSVFFTGNSPVPDPEAQWRGMSWLTPVVREIQSDSAATTHKLKFFERGATPGYVVTYDQSISPDDFAAFVKMFKEQHEGAGNAYKTLHFGGGTDIKTVGADLKQLDFKVTQGAGETRISAAAGVPPIIVGLSEGLSASTYSNYGQARRKFADHFARPHWRMVSASLERLVDPPAGAHLWYDDRDIAFLREDAKEEAEINHRDAIAIRQLVEAGFDPNAVVAAVVAKDLRHLNDTHSGLTSVQLQPPNSATADI